MGSFVQHVSCKKCGSSDANAIYRDTSNNTHNSYCYACENVVQNVDKNGKKLKDKDDSFVLNSESPKPTIEAIEALPTLGIRERGIVKSVAEFYGLKVAKRGDIDKITHHYYPMTRKGKLVGFQERVVEDKKFLCVGNCKAVSVELQGQHLFQNSDKTVVVTEGFLDMMAASQMLYGKHENKRYPVISLPSGANTKAIANNLDYLNRFEKVILMLDQDAVGEKAARDIARLLAPGKAYIATYSEKDPCDMLIKGKLEEFKEAYWRAQKYSPADIVTACDARSVLTQEEVKSIPYPDFAEELNMSWYGHRLGEVVMYTAATGAGKSQFFKEDFYHLLEVTEDKIGVVSLEESVRDVFRGLQAIYLNKRIHLPDVVVSEEELENSLNWLENVVGERLVLLDHQGSSADDELLDKIRYMIAIGCKYIFIDHVTIAVSEQSDTNAAIDSFMSDILKLCKRHNVFFGVVSHLRKTQSGSKSFENGAIPTDDDLRGSGSLKQIAFSIIAFVRNKMAKDPIVRNTTSIYVLKDRYTGRTGFAGKFIYSAETGRLQHTGGIQDENPEEVLGEDEDGFELA